MALKTIKGYLEELGSHLYGRKPSGEVSGILAETELHLRESTAELAETPDPYVEHFAVEQFGEATKIARRFLAPEPKPYWRAALVPVLALLILGFLPLTMFLLFADNREGLSNLTQPIMFWSISPLLLIVGTLVVLFIVGSFIAKRILAKAIGLTTLFVVSATTLWLSIFTVALYPDLGHGIVMRSDVESDVAHANAQIPKLKQWKALCLAAEKFYVAHDAKYEGTFKGPRGYLVPTGVTTVAHSNWLEFKLATVYMPDLHKAKEALSLGSRGMIDMHLIREQDVSNLNELAKNPPLSQFRGFFLDGSPVYCLFGLLALVLNVFSYLVGLGVSRVLWPRRRYA